MYYYLTIKLLSIFRGVHHSYNASQPELLRGEGAIAFFCRNAKFCDFEHFWRKKFCDFTHF